MCVSDPDQPTSNNTAAPGDDRSDNGSGGDSGGGSNGGGAVSMFVAVVFRSAVALAILAAGAGVFYVLYATRTAPAHSGSETNTMLVRTVETQRLKVRRTWEGYGTARSMRVSDVVAEVAGMVVERPERIEPGRRVAQGDVLVRLDTTDTANALRAAEQASAAIEAQLSGLSVETDRLGTQIGYARDEIAASERDLARIRAAVEAGAGNEAQIDAALAQLRRLQREADALEQRLDLIPSRRAQLFAQLESQRASAETARKNLERATIRSPLSGMIQRVDPRRGDWVARGTPVARVVDLSLLEVPLRLPAGAISWVERGDPVSIWTGDPLGEPDHEGTITRVAPEADERSRTITVFVEIEQDPRDAERLAPGRFVLGRVRPLDPTPRIVVPRRVIDQGRVMLAAQEPDSDLYTIVARPVRVGYSFDETIERLDPRENQWTVVVEGLNEGELVVTSLLDQLVEGLRVGLVSENSGAVLGEGAGDESGNTSGSMDGGAGSVARDGGAP